MEIGRLMENADRQSQDIEACSSSRSGVAYPVLKAVIAVVVQFTWQMIAQLQKERSVITVKKLNILLRCVEQNHRGLVK